MVADRLVRFAGLVGRENVIAGTDCGFAQIEGLQRVHPQVMWAKLKRSVKARGSPHRNCGRSSPASARNAELGGPP